MFFLYMVIYLSCDLSFLVCMFMLIVSYFSSQYIYFFSHKHTYLCLICRYMVFCLLSGMTVCASKVGMTTVPPFLLMTLNSRVDAPCINSLCVPFALLPNRGLVTFAVLHKDCIENARTLKQCNAPHFYG